VALLRIGVHVCPHFKHTFRGVTFVCARGLFHLRLLLRLNVVMLTCLVCLLLRVVMLAVLAIDLRKGFAEIPDFNPFAWYGLC
jgi:hypothetical protein